ncbi:unnamed protein product [Rotaria magnacalcarata]|uniref:Major facilitator superfamily (MFS) profile domain-containing protein n=1 Tax=Rotaria magnacalcarata TaxID=392030 RepID=A0A816G8G6_9BILA|nr:unnamed protein product [Rotaria magnacalcarata]CAF1671717.1 unnamed protein product [Rotaria magnacalcarata]CAF2146113.1 unnamed protein product [Rotaria magnacalcarata]CAF2268499.1 unnamed protein product [Rotaria magnacalcarata]CAF3954493.1 unnamed protein product [Rotaria magnacalcarata]
MNLDSLQSHYGVVIVLITFVSRIIFIGFSWSYGTIIVQFKKQNSTLSDTEMSWIGSIGQSFGGLLAPLILFTARRFGFQISFVVSLFICVLSLFISSIVQNLHWLLLTYSLPYGFGNAAIFILGTLICGLYFPAGQHPKHILVMCIISMGFPLGYHVMSASIFSALKENSWQSMKRHIAVIELFVTCILGPFFTTKFLPSTSLAYPYPSAALVPDPNRKIYYSKPVIYWMLGIFSSMCAVNNFLLHLHSHLEYLLISAARADRWFRLHGLFDALFRLLIPALLRFYPIDIIYLFPASVFTGLIVLTLTFALLYTSLNVLAILPIILFSFTPAVVTALQYTVSNRIFEEDRTEQGYIYHVIVTSLGTIVGPVVGGLFLDMTGSYKAIIPTSIFFLFVSFVSFIVTIVLLNRKKSNQLEEDQTASIHQHDNVAYGSSN